MIDATINNLNMQYGIDYFNGIEYFILKIYGRPDPSMYAPDLSMYAMEKPVCILNMAKTNSAIQTFLEHMMHHCCTVSSIIDISPWMHHTMYIGAAHYIREIIYHVGPYFIATAAHIETVYPGIYLYITDAWRTNTL